MFRRKRPLEEIITARVKNFVKRNNIGIEGEKNILDRLLSNYKLTSDLKFCYRKNDGSVDIILDDIVRMDIWVGFEDSYV